MLEDDVMSKSLALILRTHLDMSSSQRYIQSLFCKIIPRCRKLGHQLLEYVSMYKYFKIVDIVLLLVMIRIMFMDV